MDDQPSNTAEHRCAVCDQPMTRGRQGFVYCPQCDLIRFD